MKPSKPTGGTLKAAIYARVSTEDQHCQMQITELAQFAERMGWSSVQYIEKESTRKRRPALEQLMQDCAQHQVDVVLVWKLDRFGRSVQELVGNIQALDRAGVRFVCPSQSIDTDQRNPTSKLLIHILASVAEFERDLIRERVTAGLSEYKRAFASGKVGKDRHSKSGKDLAPHRPQRVFPRDEAARMRKAGKSWGEISAKLGVPKSTIRLALRSVA